MHLLTKIFTASILSFLLASPLPDDTGTKALVARIGRNDGGDPANAIDVRLDATGWEINADQDAWAMLCAEPPRPRVLRRLEEEDLTERRKHKSKHYRNSGAGALPNKGKNPIKYNLRQPHLDPGAEPWESTEEFPFESTDVAGESSETHQRQVILFPSRLTDQRRQGARLSNSLDKAKVHFGSWFHITGFDNCDRVYCQAFNRNDFSVCLEKQEGEDDWDEFAFVRISNPGQKMAFADIGKKHWEKRDLSHSDELPARNERSIITAEHDALDIAAEETSAIEKRDLSDVTPESEVVLDNIPAIDHD